MIIPKVELIPTNIRIIILLFVYEFMYVNCINIVDLYMNTIGDMQIEMHFFYHCNEFVYNHDFVIFF